MLYRRRVNASRQEYYSFAKPRIGTFPSADVIMACLPLTHRESGDEKSITYAYVGRTSPHLVSLMPGLSIVHGCTPVLSTLGNHFDS